MKKLILLFLILTTFAGYSQAVFDEGIQNPAATSDSTPAYFTTTQSDGVHKKTPAALIATMQVVQDSLDKKLNISDLPTNLVLYPTTAASDVSGYVKMVTDIHALDYNTTAVDVSTSTITGTNQLVSQRISDAGVLIGQPGVFNITTFGNIRRLSGSGTAEFFFRVYHRDAAGTETLICTSSTSAVVTGGTYAEFSASALWDDGNFIATDRIVIKTYANRIGGGTNPVYQFQFGGTQPVRTLLPVPFKVVDAGYEVKTNKSDSYTASSSTTYASTKALVDGLDVKANEADVIHTNATPETKIGGLTIGRDSKVLNDKWIAFGTSVTDLDKYTVPTAKMLNIEVLNYGASGSASSTLAGLYGNIPTWTNEYRLLSIEHSINDCQTFVDIATFRANILAMVNNARSKGWANNRILLINGNECSNVLPNNANFESYANEVMDLAKDEGLQYYDVYNYTKNNGGHAILTDDGIHPNDFGGEIYARGLVASLQGGVEVGGGLTVDNSIKTFGSLEVKKDITTLGSIKTGNDPQNNPTHNSVGDIVIPTNAGIASQFVNNNYQTRITPIEIIGGSYLATTFRNYTDYGGFEWFVAKGVPGAQNNVMSLQSDGKLVQRESILSPSFVNSVYANGFPNWLLKADGGVFDNTTIFLKSGGTISGNVVVDGNFKYKYSTSITGTDLNNLKEAGFFNGSSLTNAPNSNSGFFWITVENHDSSTIWIHQTATSYGSGNDTNEIYSRVQMDGVWQPWQKIAYINSPSFTGTPTAPTATAGTNTTQIATTAFVQGVRPYKVYTALLTQTSTSAPTDTVLENTLGGTVVWTRTGTGAYLATLSGAFTTSKTLVFITQTSGSSIVSASYSSVNDISVSTANSTTANAIDGVLSNSSVEIRVYP